MKRHIVEYKQKEEDIYFTMIVFDSPYLQQCCDKADELKARGYFEVLAYTDKSFRD